MKTGPWLYHPAGYVLYRFDDKHGPFYNFHGAANAGYRDWKAAAKLKGLNPDDFVPYKGQQCA